MLAKRLPSPAASRTESAASAPKDPLPHRLPPFIHPPNSCPPLLPCSAALRTPQRVRQASCACTKGLMGIFERDERHIRMGQGAHTKPLNGMQLHAHNALLSADAASRRMGQEQRSRGREDEAARAQAEAGAGAGGWRAGSRQEGEAARGTPSKRWNRCGRALRWQERPGLGALLACWASPSSSRAGSRDAWRTQMRECGVQRPSRTRAPRRARAQSASDMAA